MKRTRRCKRCASPTVPEQAEWRIKHDSLQHILQILLAGESNNEILWFMAPDREGRHVQAEVVRQVVSNHASRDGWSVPSNDGHQGEAQRRFRLLQLHSAWHHDHLPQARRSAPIGMQCSVGVWSSHRWLIRLLRRAQLRGGRALL